ncbi:glycosyltransferase family 4 protein [Shewanella baltica]|uniref:glycosyltransferase family 4 protein n=1 Tax=Shewanella baltica TaxID=62322 RepID=UPI0039852E65
MNKNLIFIVNVDWFFVSHRLPIALKAISEGYNVTIACHFTTHRCEIEEMGLKTIEVPFNRSGSSFFNEIKTLFLLRRIIRSEKPSIVHAVTIKPVLYSGLVLKTLRDKISFVAAISGLGYVFTADNLRAKLTRRIASLFYKVSLSHDKKIVIFQNSSDESILTSVANIKAEQKVLIKGSGADLKTYNYTQENCSQNIKVVMACRLLREKGVYEFVEAARQVKKRFPESKFLLVGAPDLDNPNTVTQHEIEQWVEENLIIYLGQRTDIPSIFSDSNIVCLPSFYGEGVPKVLIEAAACGRAIVTTDNPGCRDAVKNGITGLCVPVKDANALAAAIIKLIESPKLRQEMGASARIFAENEFDVQAVVDKHLKIYQHLLS